MNARAVLFDLDGTLLDTLEDIADSMNAVLESSGYPPHELSAYSVFVGDGIHTLVERALPQEHRSSDDVEAALRGMNGEYQKRWNAKSKPYPGIAEMLDALTERRIPKAVFSNKPHHFTIICVEELLDRWQFDVARGIDEKTPRKPDATGALRIANDLEIDPSEFLYVGDTNTDMRTAINAGMFPVGVSWGFRPVEELLENGAKEILREPSDLLRLL